MYSHFFIHFWSFRREFPRALILQGLVHWFPRACPLILQGLAHWFPLVHWFSKGLSTDSQGLPPILQGQTLRVQLFQYLRPFESLIIDALMHYLGYQPRPVGVKYCHNRHVPQYFFGGPILCLRGVCYPKGPYRTVAETSKNSNCLEPQGSVSGRDGVPFI